METDTREVTIIWNAKRKAKLNLKHFFLKKTDIALTLNQIPRIAIKEKRL
jgi:hypothetical protein